MSTLLLEPAQIDWALEFLRADEVVGVPSETVYGLAGRAFSEKALARIFSLKNRPHFDPLIVHVGENDSWITLVKEPPRLAQELARAFWPGPLTLVMEKSARISELCTAGTGWVALRSPAHPVFQNLLQKLGEPLAAPSANRFGRISPTDARAVVQELGPWGLPAVLEGGACARGVESTVLKVVGENEIEIIRPGALSVESLLEKFPKLRWRRRESGSGMTTDAPGQLAVHYAPAKLEVKFMEEKEAEAFARARDLSRTILLSVFPPPAALQKLNWREVSVLSPEASDLEAAARLFRVLRHFDERAEEGETLIALAASGPEKGLLPAIHDRLRRASRARSFG